MGIEGNLRKIKIGERFMTAQVGDRFIYKGNDYSIKTQYTIVCGGMFFVRNER